MIQNSTIVEKTLPTNEGQIRPLATAALNKDPEIL